MSHEVNPPESLIIPTEVGVPTSQDKQREKCVLNTMDVGLLTQKSHMTNRVAIGLLVGVVLLYLVQQAIGLNLRWVDDETWYLLAAKSFVEESRFRIPVFEGYDHQFWAAPPLLTLLQSGSWLLHSLTVIQARALTVVFGAGVVGLTYALGSRLLGRQVGFVAALLCSMDNMIFLAGRTVRPEILVAFFTLLALWLFVKAQQEGTRWPIVAAGFAVAAGVSSHPNGAVAAVCGVAFLVSREKLRAFTNSRLYLFAGSCFVAFLPLLLWVVLNDAQSGFQGLQGLASLHSHGGSTLLARVQSSASREFFLRFIPFVAFPYRLHIAILCVAAVLAGLLRRRSEIRFLAACVVLHLLFFLLVVKANKSPRYLTLVMPFLAILWAEWIVSLHRLSQGHGIPRSIWSKGRCWSAMAAVVFLLAGLSQLAGNMAYLWKYRSADYPEVCRQIDALIPPHSTVYGGMAFWMNLRHHTYVPYMRMPWEKAVEEYHPNILILDDWVMVKGSGPGEWDALRQELHEYADKHGTFLGGVDNPFYGNLKVYAVSYDSVSRTSSDSAL